MRLWAWLSNIPSLLGIFAAQMMASGSILSSLGGISFESAVLAIGGVIFLSNVMSGMWGVVAADFFQVSIIVIGIPLTAFAAMGQVDTGTFTHVLTAPFVPEGMGAGAIVRHTKPPPLPELKPVPHPGRGFPGFETALLLSRDFLESTGRSRWRTTRLEPRSCADGDPG